MKYKNTYKIIEGSKEIFEKKINELITEDFIWSWAGNMNTMPTREGMHYSILMFKSELINESKV